MKKLNVEQGTSEWFHLKKGISTGTDLKGIMGTPYAKKEALYSFVANHFLVGVDEDISEENAMDRGIRLEPEAIAMFEFETGKEVERVGICISDKNEKIGNSPDGLIGEKEAVEVKCLGAKKHIQTIDTNEVPKEYYWQGIQYFVVNEKLETLYFIFYHPDFEGYPLHIIPIKRKDILEEIKTATEEQEKFLSEATALLLKLRKN